MVLVAAGGRNVITLPRLRRSSRAQLQTCALSTAGLSTLITLERVSLLEPDLGDLLIERLCDRLTDQLRRGLGRRHRHVPKVFKVRKSYARVSERMGKA